jgi:DNA-binding MarR family transcriptional regulator
MAAQRPLPTEQTRSISPSTQATVFKPGENTNAWLGLHLLVITNRYLQSIYDDIERRHSLLRDDVAVILCLSITTATTAQQIARYTGRPKNSISRSVTTLAERHLVHRQPHPVDGRAIALQLTAAGKRIFRDINGDFAARDTKLLDPLTTNERRQFIELAVKISAASSEWE